MICDKIFLFCHILYFFIALCYKICYNMFGDYIMDNTDIISCLNILDEQIQLLFTYKEAISKIKQLCEDDDSILAWDIINIIDFI